MRSARAQGNEREHDGQPGLIATAARGKTAPGEALEESHELKEMRGERDGLSGLLPPQPAGEKPQER